MQHFNADVDICHAPCKHGVGGGRRTMNLKFELRGIKIPSDKVGLIGFAWIGITRDYNTMPKSGVKSATIDRRRHRWRASVSNFIARGQGGFPEYDEIFNPPEIHRILKSAYVSRSINSPHSYSTSKLACTCSVKNG